MKIINILLEITEDKKSDTHFVEVPLDSIKWKEINKTLKEGTPHQRKLKSILPLMKTSKIIKK